MPHICSYKGLDHDQQHFGRDQNMQHANTAEADLDARHPISAAKTSPKKQARTSDRALAQWTVAEMGPRHHYWLQEKIAKPQTLHVRLLVDRDLDQQLLGTGQHHPTCLKRRRGRPGACADKLPP
jgi:hypothetical protein